MTTQSLGRMTLLLAVAVALLGATILFVPAPAEILVALLSLPLGAYLLSRASSAS